jgi:hypothetical protein
VQVRVAGADKFRSVASLGPGGFLRPAPEAGAPAPANDAAAAAAAGPGGVLGSDGAVYVPLVHSDEWLYIDDDGNEQGPFTFKQMAEWYEAEYFGPATRVKRAPPIPPGAVDYIDFEEIGEDGMELFSFGREDVARENSKPLPAAPAAPAAPASAPAAQPAAPQATSEAKAAPSLKDESKAEEILWQYIDDDGESLSLLLLCC